MTTEPREAVRVWQPTGVVSLRLIGARPLMDVDETPAHWPPGFKELKQAIAEAPCVTPATQPRHA